MAVVGDSALMQRAAHGLSVRSADLLARTRGTVYGSRVVILIGPGDNGGDALYAGQRLARRGCAVTAVSALGQPHAAGLAALLAAAAERTIPVLAVDLPSGVSADTGLAPSGSVRAIRTVTFGTYKPCHLIEPAASRSGLIE